MRFWMNLFTRLAKWCEAHRVIRQDVYDVLATRVDKIERDTNATLEIRALKQRLDHLELFVGMKRQKQSEPANIPKIG